MKELFDIRCGGASSGCLLTLSQGVRKKTPHMIDSKYENEMIFFFQGGVGGASFWVERGKKKDESETDRLADGQTIV